MSTSWVTCTVFFDLISGLFRPLHPQHLSLSTPSPLPCKMLASRTLARGARVAAPSSQVCGRTRDAESWLANGGRAHTPDFPPVRLCVTDCCIRWPEG